MAYFIQHLPGDLVTYIKDYVLSVDIKLEMLYDKYKIDEKFIKKRVMVFNSKQLEQINWKYLYYKIFTVSPPKCDNNRLAPIFDIVPDEYYRRVDPELNLTYDNLKYKLSCESIKKFWLNSAIIRSDYYSDNVKTEMGRKRQQNYNILRAWYYIKNGRWSSDIAEFNWYMCNVEYELLKALIVLYGIKNRGASKRKVSKSLTRS